VDHREPKESTPPRLQHSGPQDIIPGLAKARKDCKEIKATVDAAFGEKSLQKLAIYAIIKKVNL
jgi:hypothetical protein